MATALSETTQPTEQGLSLRPPVTGTTALTVNVPPASAPRVPEWYEASGVTALATMISVLATVVFGVWNTQRQLKNAREEAERTRKHESDEAQVNRLMTARREVYSEFVDRFTAAQVMFGQLKAMDITSLELGAEIRALGAPVNKTWVISEEATALKARELLTVMNENYLGLLPLLGPIARSNLILKEYLDQEKALEQRLAELVRNDVRGSNLTEIQIERKDIASLQPLMLGEQERHARFVKNYDSQMLGYQTKVMRLVNDLMLSVRQEMKLPGDSSRLAAQSADMTNRMLAAMEKFHADIDEMNGIPRTSEA